VSRSQETLAARGRAVAAARAGWGCLLLLAPRRVLGTRVPVPAAAVVVVRVLGARQILQAAVTASAPTGAVAVGSASVDALHAGSCVGFAAVRGPWRRAALTDAVVATALAAVGWSCRGRTAEP
jgi:hypothetical protein